MRLTASLGTLLAACTVMLVGCTSTASPLKTYDGLVAVPDAKFGEVYRKPGAELSGYGKIGLLPCEVSFRRNWLRDQQNSSLNLQSRISQEDVENIRKALGAACDEHLREALLREPPYALAETFQNGEQVLVVNPSIINLDINAPDTFTAGRSRSYTTSAGEMTLLLEVSDATTGELLVRAVDRRRGHDSGYLQWTNSVTNRADALRVLNRWADLFREGLDEAVGH